MAEQTHFFDWILGAQVEKSKAEAAAPAAGKPIHLQVGEWLASVVPGLALTKDIYGEGATTTGSPWKVEGDHIAELAQALTGQGYKANKKDGWKSGTVQVDAGFRKGTTFVYISDDN